MCLAHHFTQVTHTWDYCFGLCNVYTCAVTMASSILITTVNYSNEYGDSSNIVITTNYLEGTLKLQFKKHLLEKVPAHISKGNTRRHAGSSVNPLAHAQLILRKALHFLCSDVRLRSWERYGFLISCQRHMSTCSGLH